MSEWVSEWVSELESEWVSFLRQSNSPCHMQTFISSKSRFFLFFAFRFSLFAFRFSLVAFRFHFSLFDHRSVSCCNCYLRTWIRECLSEWVSEWVRKWVSKCFTSIKQLMQTFIWSKSRFVLFFAFRFSFFAFRFSIIGLIYAFAVLCLSTWVSECMSERVSELENEWVIYVNQTAHAINRDSFRQSLDSFCSSFFAFRFSLFVFRFSLFDHRAVSCCYCYLRTWIVSEWVSVLESEWVSECITSIKQLMP